MENNNNQGDKKFEPGFKLTLGIKKTWKWILSSFVAGGTSYLIMGRVIKLLEQFSSTFKQKLSKISPSDRVYLQSKFGSSIHAFLASLWPIKLIFFDNIWKKDVVCPYPASLDIYFGSHFGYTLFEILLFIIRKEPLSLWFHHAIDAYGSFLLTCYREAAFFPAIFGISEMTIVPQNAIYYYQILKLNQPWLYKTLQLWRAVFYLIFRTFIGPFSFYYGLSGNRLTWTKFKNVNPIVTFCSLFNVLSLTYLNTDWTIQVFISAYKAFKK